MMNIRRVGTVEGLLKAGLLIALCIVPSFLFVERYSLEGLVADEQGNAINDVTLHVTESKFSRNLQRNTNSAFGSLSKHIKARYR